MTSHEWRRGCGSFFLHMGSNQPISLETLVFFKSLKGEMMGWDVPNRRVLECVTECDGRWVGGKKIGKSVDVVYGQPFIWTFLCFCPLKKISTQWDRVVLFSGKKNACCIWRKYERGTAGEGKEIGKETRNSFTVTKFYNFSCGWHTGAKKYFKNSKE